MKEGSKEKSKEANRREGRKEARKEAVQKQKQKLPKAAKAEKQKKRQVSCLGLVWDLILIDFGLSQTASRGNQ